MKIIGIIPARYGSTRFPGKPLADIHGKSMIRRVHEQAGKAGVLDEVIIATDDRRILSHVLDFGGKAVLTSDRHGSGTERCLEALDVWSRKLGKTWDGVINIQGDEPFIHPEQIMQIAGMLEQRAPIATLVKEITDDNEVADPNVVKVVAGEKGQAVYFSRAVVPFVGKSNQMNGPGSFPFLKHVGIYGYQAEILRAIALLPPTSLEKTESLEQLRWLGHGYNIFIAKTDRENIAVDTPEDLSKITNRT